MSKVFTTAFLTAAFFLFITAGFTAKADVARFSPFDTIAMAPSGVTHLGNTNPDAPQGGTIRLGATVNFDSMNFLRFPGQPPKELSHTFDRLLVSGDAPATYYGLLASEIDIAPDFSVARFVIDKDARWHDGTAVTSHDVAFTFETVGRYGIPFFRTVIAGLTIETPDERTIVLTNNKPSGWRWIDQLGRYPIQSRAWWKTRDPSEITLEIPLGSGPFRITEADFNRRLILDRAPNYWAADHPVNQGRWNFDRISVEYFFDSSVMIEALKRGDIDVLRDTRSASASSVFDGPAMQEGRLVRSDFRRNDAGDLHFLVMNLRKPPLEDIRVREALNLAFDESFYHDLWGGRFDYPRGFYGNSRLAASGLPNAAEKALLAPFADALPQGLLDMPPPALGENMRPRFRRAIQLISEAGYTLEQGKFVDPATAEPLTLLFVSDNPNTARQLEPFKNMLERVGITLEIQSQDFASSRRLILDHAFDLTPVMWRAGDPPGAIERLYWHSERAGRSGYGLAGLESPVADALIDLMHNSDDQTEIVAAARAFDRFLRFGYYTIPMWHDNHVRYVHDARLGYPDTGGVSAFAEVLWFWRQSPG